MVIVPTNGLSKEGDRVGYGGGYYDKLLSNKAFKAFTIGFCFSFQIKKDL